MATTTDKGEKEFQQFFAKLKELHKSYVSVGVHQDAGSYPGGEDVLTVGLAHEFGVPDRGLPERSYMRSAIDENQEKLNRWQQELAGKIMGADRISVPKALNILGARIQILMQNKLKSDIPPPLTPDYEEWKIKQGFTSDTLIMTKLLMRSITYKVHRK